MTRALLCLGLLLSSGPAVAALQAGNFTLGNQSGQPLANVAIRDFGGGPWRPLTSSLGPADRQPIAFTDDDCAFDIRADLPGGEHVVWQGVNLCDVRVVVLSRRPDGTIWVDYD